MPPLTKSAADGSQAFQGEVKSWNDAKARPFNLPELRHQTGNPEPKMIRPMLNFKSESYIPHALDLNPQPSASKHNLELLLQGFGFLHAAGAQQLWGKDARPSWET